MRVRDELDGDFRCQARFPVHEFCSGTVIVRDPAVMRSAVRRYSGYSAGVVHVRGTSVVGAAVSSVLTRTGTQPGAQRLRPLRLSATALPSFRVGISGTFHRRTGTQPDVARPGLRINRVGGRRFRCRSAFSCPCVLLLHGLVFDPGCNAVGEKSVRLPAAASPGAGRCPVAPAPPFMPPRLRSRHIAGAGSEPDFTLRGILGADPGGQPLQAGRGVSLGSEYEAFCSTAVLDYSRQLPLACVARWRDALRIPPTRGSFCVQPRFVP